MEASDNPNNDDWVKAGRIAAEVLEFGRSRIRKGATILEVCDSCDRKIEELGAVPAFPTQVSCDDIAAHFCPTEEDSTEFDSQLACLDVGACFNGAIGDNALTVDLSGRYTELVRASRDALDQAIKIAQIGTTLGEIGKAIQETIQGYGFSPIRNLSGHGLGLYNIHDEPTVPNIATQDKTALKKGMHIAIEPFASTGKGVIYESSHPTLFAFEARKPVRSQFAREILNEIGKYKGLPFTTRWITRKFGAMKASIGLRELVKVGVLRNYAPLPDMEHGMVSQAEHSLLIDDKVIVTTKPEG